jgi:hypothetical protein
VVTPPLLRQGADLLDVPLPAPGQPEDVDLLRVPPPSPGPTATKVPMPSVRRWGPSARAGSRPTRQSQGMPRPVTAEGLIEV